MEPDKKIEGARSFARALELISDGELVSEAGRELHELLKAIDAHAKMYNVAKGSLTLKIDFEKEADTVDIKYDVTTKRPKPRRQKYTAWLTKGGNLSPENPRQQSLPLKIAPVATESRVADDNAEARGV